MKHTLLAAVAALTLTAGSAFAASNTTPTYDPVQSGPTIQTTDGTSLYRAPGPVQSALEGSDQLKAEYQAAMRRSEAAGRAGSDGAAD